MRFLAHKSYTDDKLVKFLSQHCAVLLTKILLHTAAPTSVFRGGKSVAKFSLLSVLEYDHEEGPLKKSYKQSMVHIMNPNQISTNDQF